MNKYEPDQDAWGMMVMDPILSRLMRRVFDLLAPKRCEYEYGESYYGAGDALPCGREAVGTSIEAEEPRCRQHLNEE